MLIRHTGLPLFLVALVAIAAGPSFARGTKPAVSLLLSKASAERREHDTLFRCDLLLDNTTNKDLTVRSNFSSVFDGLELVVTTHEGKLLAQQGYTFHQSPFAPPGRDFTLKQGTTKGTLVFPIGELPREVKILKVRLVGVLPGSEYRRILSSETIEVTVKE
jgi:hypothetical protein